MDVHGGCAHLGSFKAQTLGISVPIAEIIYKPECEPVPAGLLIISINQPQQEKSNLEPNPSSGH